MIWVLRLVVRSGKTFPSRCRRSNVWKSVHRLSNKIDHPCSCSWSRFIRRPWMLMIFRVGSNWVHHLFGTKKENKSCTHRWLRAAQQVIVQTVCTMKATGFWAMQTWRYFVFVFRAFKKPNSRISNRYNHQAFSQLQHRVHHVYPTPLT